MPKAVTFDVDGALVDFVDLPAQAWRDAFREHGRDIAFDSIRGQIGKGGDQLMPEFLSKGDIEAFPGVRALFERLRAERPRIALASSAKEDELETYKETADIGDLVDEQTSSDDADSSKPHPDIFLAALEKLGNPDPRDAIVVGGTPYDAEAAGKAGLRMVGVPCGGFPEDGLRKAGCIAV